jgi:hypothetical protein
VADSLEHGNEPSGSIKGREFLERLSDSFSECEPQGAAEHGLLFTVMRRSEVTTTVKLRLPLQ